MNVMVCFCTVPSEEVARSIAEVLVGERLAACVNTVPGIRSTYRWEGEVQSDEELMLIIKTTAAGFAKLRERVVQLHPYDCPELLAWSVEHGLPDYLSWVAQEVG